MKRILLSLLAGVAVFGAVFGFAAAITPTSDNLGAGDAAVGVCGASAVVHYKTAYNDSSKEYNVTHVIVDGASTCADGSKVTVTLTKSDGTFLGDATGTLTSGASADLAVGEPVVVDEVGNADVIVHSAGSSTATRP